MSPEAEYLRLLLVLTVLYNSSAQRHNPLLDDPLAVPRHHDKTSIEESSPLSRLRQSSSLSLLDDPLLDAVTSLGRQSLLDELLSAGFYQLICVFIDITMSRSELPEAWLL